MKYQLICVVYHNLPRGGASLCPGHQPGHPRPRPRLSHTSNMIVRRLDGWLVGLLVSRRLEGWLVGKSVIISYEDKGVTISTTNILCASNAPIRAIV